MDDYINDEHGLRLPLSDEEQFNRLMMEFLFVNIKGKEHLANGHILLRENEDGEFDTVFMMIIATSKGSKKDKTSILKTYAD